MGNAENVQPIEESNVDPSAADLVASSLNDGKSHLLIAATGSVAVIKLPSIISSLAHHPNLSIRVILTSSALRFFTGASAEQPSISDLASLPNVAAIYTDEDEWSAPWSRGSNILHIELRRWADIMVIAPLSANTLAKVVNGMADNLVTSVIRAWDVTPAESTDNEVKRRMVRRRIAVAPAMNVAMWLHPITAKQIRVLEEEWGVSGKGNEGWFEVLWPQKKILACGDVGQGGMCEVEKIVHVIEERLLLGGGP